MCIGENNIRRPGDHRERAEGERPGPGPADARLPTLHGKGKTLFRTLFSPCKF